jgi:hypothetical protein
MIDLLTLQVNFRNWLDLFAVMVITLALRSDQPYFSGLPTMCDGGHIPHVMARP